MWPALLTQMIALFGRNEFPVKQVLWVLAGACWLLASLAFLMFLMEYVAEGAGLQFFGWALWSGTVLIGLVHVVGLFLGSGFCFVIGVGLCAHGLVSSRPRDLQRS
jgi:hypothetical protein